MLKLMGVGIHYLPENILKKIFIDANGCWNWSGADSGNGYGKCWYEGRWQVAHRAIYQFFVADIPKGHHLDHRCRNRGCVNPHHMEPVTPKVNTHRGKAVLFKKKEEYDGRA